MPEIPHRRNPGEPGDPMDDGWAEVGHMGQWGYQLIYEKARKIKKNPIGFALPSPDEQNTEANPPLCSNDSSSTENTESSPPGNPSAGSPRRKRRKSSA